MWDIQSNIIRHTKKQKNVTNEKKKQLIKSKLRMRWLDGITDSMDMNLATPGVGDGQTWHAAVHGVAKSRTRLSD